MSDRGGGAAKDIVERHGTGHAGAVTLPLLLPPGAVEEVPSVIVAVMAELSCAVTDTPPAA